MNIKNSDKEEKTSNDSFNSRSCKDRSDKVTKNRKEKNE